MAGIQPLPGESSGPAARINQGPRFFIEIFGFISSWFHRRWVLVLENAGKW
jgi:hypothetical protein